MKIFSRSVILFFIVGLSTIYPQYQAGYENALKTISEKELKENLSFLASDSLKGRPAGSDENLIAAMFIANKFKEYGLKGLVKSKFRLPAGEKNDEALVEINLEDSKEFNEYFQGFSIQQSKLSGNNSFFVKSGFENGSIVKSFTYDVDFLLQFSNPENISVTAPVVFAGYGIDKGENGYNDYLDASGNEVPVKNKIVVIIDGFPQENDSLSTFSKSRNALYRNPVRKAEAAAKLGALAVIVVQSPFKTEPPLTIKYETINTNFKRQSFQLPEQKKDNIPIIYVNQQIAAELLSGYKIKEKLDGIEKNLKPAAAAVEGKEVSFSINFETKILNTQNVIGLIEGTDPDLKDEYVVVGAHYDHVGLGYYGAMFKTNIGKIHNGADDNGSGTAALIELAEAFSKAPPKRSILFIAFSGEENALLGSKYYVNHQPLKPLDKTTAMLNLDMVGRNEDKLLWIGGGFYGDDIRKIVEKANGNIGFEVLYNTGLLSYASDHGPFLRKKIPAAFFFTGMHDQYHAPEDDVDLINFPKLTNVTKLAYLTGSLIGNSEDKPVYRELSSDEKAELVKESLSRQYKYRPKNNNH
jgi:hypothetical protein